MASRRPVRMSGTTAGMITRRSSCPSPAPRLRATLIHSGFTWLTPWAVLITKGHTVATAIRKYTGGSPTPKAMMAMGIQARGEIMRKN